MYYKTYSEIKSGLNDGSLNSFELCNSYIQRIEAIDPVINAFLRLNKAKISEEANESDKRRKNGKPLSDMDGIPIGLKDNICIQGEKTTCGSKILENFVSPYNATVIEKLKSKGFILFPGLNMDEFAMGSSTENSAYQTTKNPFDTSRIPGGSSGGSAAAVASSMLPLALGSDTGGSIRQPASLCGIWGLKPTYGRVSRYGLVAYASSLDQIGPFSNDPQGVIDVLSVISGKDLYDSTSANTPAFSSIDAGKIDISKIRIGIMKPNPSEWEQDIVDRYKQVVEKLAKSGAAIIELDFSLHSYSIPIYYIIATAECSSNLARFDGIRYGLRVDNGGKLEDLYINSKTSGFGDEVKRRILLGTFTLSSGYYDAYYGKAQKARILIKKSYDEFFKQVDFILQPTSPTTAFKTGERTKDPIQMYMADVLTTSVNLAGIPSISIPAGLDSKGLPIGLQITSPAFQEGKLLSLVNELARYPELKIQLPKEIK
ncbi:MAG: Asp-tRNA(Asn)/Glu-tRNA(Gln) amidotransferase subunit GatA [Leptospiraceae bacterium]|nr:Asp-tRNA(Asn)/Glu-tRNA(Gln) amidotransferase subunit GatA [Leptospiraceae bacterium]MCP5494468.1 Asp-tRNA(Asn)/Glu-tRNA(Gln) amidotransferase subunit GatA [Leptospiraceae bacterium]